MGKSRSAEGDEAFEALFRREVTPLVRALTVLSGDRQSAADAVQDAFLQAHRHWPKVSTLDNPGAWVRRAAVNRVHNQHRGRRRLVAAFPRLHRDEEAPATADGGERLDLVSAVSELPEQQRAAVALYYLLDQPTSEIADALGITEATVRSHLRNARERLGHTLREVTQ